MGWAYFCWRGGGGLVFSSLPLAADVADCSGGRIFGGFAVVGQNVRGGWPRRYCGGLQTGGKRLLPPRLIQPQAKKRRANNHVLVLACLVLKTGL
ncbi:hypothetical protein NDU88_001780 [Pleurodeles waltl]|uniref:Secreted protein n=1 Tax=Pleurodeles waltl TaxID=8319 RepID=A0AAV7KQD7_PLEWA|nr:hypothetical protein NDU88_001780 [Pleurodeles waltl]